MDNLKYYNDSFAYNYDIFITQPKKKAEIHDYPVKRRSKSTSNAKKRNTRLARNFIISAMVVMSVCASLFLRAEISSMRSEINEIEKEIVEIDSEITRLNVEMERKVSVINLEKAAIDLGMQKCEKSQITYIKTNDTDTAENYKGELVASLNNN